MSPATLGAGAARPGPAKLTTTAELDNASPLVSDPEVKANATVRLVSAAVDTFSTCLPVGFTVEVCGAVEGRRQERAADRRRDPR
jgi:hypothetical protein